MTPLEQSATALAQEMDGANSAFCSQVSNQVRRATAELNKLEQLLLAGIVDRRILSDFRDAVNRIRRTSWTVQQCFDQATGNPTDLTTMLVQDRTRLTTQLSTQLAADLEVSGHVIAAEQIQELDRSLTHLSQAL